MTTAITWSTAREGTSQDTKSVPGPRRTREADHGRSAPSRDQAARLEPSRDFSERCFAPQSHCWLFNRDAPSYSRGFRSAPRSRRPENESDAPFPEPSVPEPCLGPAQPGMLFPSQQPRVEEDMERMGKVDRSPLDQLQCSLLLNLYFFLPHWKMMESMTVF